MRHTQKEVRALFEHAAKLHSFPDAYRLDYYQLGGGWTIVSVGLDGGTGEYRPFGEGRRSTAEMVSYLRGMVAIADYQAGHVSDGRKRGAGV